jgi:hypothetical protein
MAMAISRISFAIIIYCVALILPGIDVLEEVAGSIVGTSINILLPIVFYNRAYDGKQKNLALRENANVILKSPR